MTSSPGNRGPGGLAGSITMTSNSHLRRTSAGDRRGVLLLVVLSMLTLFLMLGAAYLVVSTRSRETARAFNRLTMQSDAVRVPTTQLVDFALLRVVRGGPRTANGGTWAPVAIPNGPAPSGFESLLGDRYGRDTITVQVKGVNTGGALLHATVSGVMSGTSQPMGTELVGRVATFLPAGQPATSHRIIRAQGDPSNGYTFVASLPPGTALPTAVPGGTMVVINGADFDGQGDTNEAWDGFDDQNPFLAHVEPRTDDVSSSTVRRPSYSTSLTGISHLPSAQNVIPLGADNDNDGVTDGVFLDFGLPQLVASNGAAIRFDVSALVVDLDSRFNVNAHGSLSPFVYPASAVSGTHRYWASGTSVPTPSQNFATVPLGSGYGPPEVNAAWMFPESNYPSITRLQPGEQPLLHVMVGATTATMSAWRRPSTSRFFSQAGVPTPQLSDLEGRYGEHAPTGTPANTALIDVDVAGFPYARPGRPFADDQVSMVNDRRVPFDPQNPSYSLNNGVPPQWWNLDPDYNWTNPGTAIPPPRSIYNSPPDLHGRMKWTTAPAAGGAGIVPRLCFAKAEWGATSGLAESADDPYEMRLDATGPRNGLASTPRVGTFTGHDNPFTHAELERILRPYDLDSAKLPARLDALLGPVSEEARHRITTDSWDTTLITGPTASTIRTWARDVENTVGSEDDIWGTTPVTGVLTGEVFRGERFDLNRPLSGSKPAQYDPTADYHLQRQAYCKDLYTLLVALTPAGQFNASRAADYAQWVVNVCDFRDADSTMTIFEYDTNPANGWDVDNDVRTVADKKPAERKLAIGFERPEVVISETSAWEELPLTGGANGELFVVLHRAWNALAFGKTGTADGDVVTIAGEPIDPQFDTPDSGTNPPPAGKPTNRLDLGRKSGGKTFADDEVYPIWRLRIDAGDAGMHYVRLDTSTAGDNEFVSSGVTSANSTPKMGVDSWTCIRGGNTLGATINTALAQVQMGNAFRVPGDPPAPGAPDREAVVYLERLTDPTATVRDDDWDATKTDPLAEPSDLTADQLKNVALYRVVDRFTIEIKNRSVAPGQQPPEPSKNTRVATGGTAFWKSEGQISTAQAISLGPLTAGTYPNNPMWLPFPNRPLISPAELFTVRGRNSLMALVAYVQNTPSTNRMVSFGLPGILDAIHVPTRFSGIHTSVPPGPNASLLESVAGIYPQTTPVNQLSSYREPGRVNLNTVVSDDVWNAVVAGPLVDQNDPTKAAPVKPRVDGNGATGANLVNQPARNMTALLALQGGAQGTAISDTNPVLMVPKECNPEHGMYTVTRLANTATVRSNVYAVWITVREITGDDPDTIRLHRGFAIVDRSVPVAHEPGRDHNVRDALVLRRVIE